MDAPVTLGQRNVLRWVGADPRADVLPEFVAVPAGVGVGDVERALATLVERHEALRTTFPGPGIQRIGAAWAPAVAGHRTEDPAALVWELMGVPFDLAHGPLLRADLIADGVLFLLFSHAAVDAAGAAIVAAQCRTLVTGGELGRPSRQPRDQAEWERSPAGQRRTRAALTHWDTVLRRIPPAMLPVPHPDGSPGHREVRMRSRALAEALPRIAARTGAGGSSVLLAATAALIAERTGTPRGAIVSICGNRFRSDWREYVGPLAQDALVPYDVGDQDLDALAAQLQTTTMGAYRHAHFDSAELWDVIDAVGRFDRDVVFNDLGARPDPPVRTATALDELPARTLPTRFFLTVGGISATEVDLRLHVDLAYVPDVEDVLLDLERRVVANTWGVSPD